MTAMRQEAPLHPEPALRAWVAGQAADARARVAACYRGPSDTPSRARDGPVGAQGYCAHPHPSFSATGSPPSPALWVWPPSPCVPLSRGLPQTLSSMAHLTEEDGPASHSQAPRTRQSGRRVLPTTSPAAGGGPGQGAPCCALTVVLRLPDGVGHAPEAREHEEHGQLVGVRPPQQEGDDAGQVGGRTCGRGRGARGEATPAGERVRELTVRDLFLVIASWCE